MEKKPPLVMTPFDESLTNDFLQLVKIILPYLPDHVQRIAGIYVKLTELMNAFYSNVLQISTPFPSARPSAFRTIGNLAVSR